MTLQEVAEHFPGGKWTPSGEYKTKCPTHDDREPSLNIGRGENGGVVICCQAGCTTKAVLDAKGLSWRDIAAPTNDSPQYEASYRYDDERGNHLATKHRKSGKSFIWRQASGAYNLNGITLLLYRAPDLLKTKPGDLILIPEGEKDVDRCWREGFAATTNPEGAAKEGQRPKWQQRYTDWLKTNLADRRFGVLPDNDEAGLAHGAAIHRSLTEARLEVVSVNLLGLPPKGDISDWFDAGHSPIELQKLLARSTNTMEVRELTDSSIASTGDSTIAHAREEATADATAGADLGTSAGTAGTPPRHELGTTAGVQVNSNVLGTQITAISTNPPGEPSKLQSTAFPLHVLPRLLRDFINQAAAALPCPVDYIAVPALAVCGVAIGRSRALEVKEGWLETPRIWSAVVGRPGDKKTPAIKLVQYPLNQLQQEWGKQYRDRKAAHESVVEEHDIDVETWKAKKREASKRGNAYMVAMPEKPESPRLLRAYTTDCTVEAMAEILVENERGIILVQDELVRWVRAMDQYHGGRGSDRQTWLSFWSGQTVLIDRKGRDEPLFLPHPFVSVSGCLPPEVVGEFMDERGREDGFIHRILFSFPDPVDIQWTDNVVSGEAAAGYAILIKLLHCLEGTINDAGYLMPQVLRFSEAGRAAWIERVTAHYRESRNPLFSDVLRGPWAKMDGYAATHALILQMMRFAAGEANEDAVDEVSVSGAFEIIDYHKAHARLIYPLLAADDEDRQLSKLIEWIKHKGEGTTTVRELVTNNVAGIKRADEARRLLADLEEMGYGQILPGERKDQIGFRLF